MEGTSRVLSRIIAARPPVGRTLVYSAARPFPHEIRFAGFSCGDIQGAADAAERNTNE